MTLVKYECRECSAVVFTDNPLVQCGCSGGWIGPLPSPKPKQGGPGTELLKIIPECFKKDGCQCFPYAERMDRWGVAGCEERFDEIVDHLCEEAKKVRIIKHFGVVNRVIAAGWVTKAIDLARTATPRVLNNGDWFVAVTTAPRRDCTLLESIESIRRAGWEPTIFAEPGATETDAETILNPERLGVWHNWLASARYALENSNASIILTVQDDSLFHPDSRTFTESILWPRDDCGFVSLYTPKHYTQLNAGRTNPVGINRIRTRSLWGACALAWPRDVIEEAVNSQTAKHWLGAGPPREKRERESAYRTRRDAWFAGKKADPSKIANSDTAIGKILNATNRPMYFVDPSPVSHIAVHSTLSHGGNTGNRNCVRCADHSRPLREQVLPPQHLKGTRMTPSEVNDRRLSDLRRFTDAIKTETPIRVIKFNDGEWHTMVGRVGTNCDNHQYSPALQKRMIDAYRYLKPNSVISDYVTNHCAYPTHTKLASQFGEPDDWFVNFAMLHDLPYAREFDCRSPELKAFYRSLRDDTRRKIFIGPKRLQPEEFLQTTSRINVPMVDAFSQIQPLTEQCVSRATEEGDPVFLMSCGFISCLLTHAIAKANPRATVIDLGSALDPILFGKTRKSQLPQSELRDFYAEFVASWPKMPHYFDEIQGWFNFPDLYSAMVKKFDGGTFVEVGCWRGKSSAYLAVEAWNSGKPFKIDCVDHFRGSIEERGSSHKDAKNRNIKGICANNLRPFWSTAENTDYTKRMDNMLRLVPKESTEASKGYADGSITFCFVDGGHSQKEVEADIKAWLPKVRSGGVLAGHDFGGSFGGVKLAVESLLPGYKRTSRNCWMYVKR